MAVSKEEMTITLIILSVVFTVIAHALGCISGYAKMICDLSEEEKLNKTDFTSYMGTNFYEYINTQICNIKSDYYGYPVIIAPVNTYLNPNLDIDTDNVHPTNQGHRHIFDAFKLVTQ